MSAIVMLLQLGLAVHITRSPACLFLRWICNWKLIFFLFSFFQQTRRTIPVVRFRCESAHRTLNAPDVLSVVQSGVTRPQDPFVDGPHFPQHGTGQKKQNDKHPPEIHQHVFQQRFGTHREALGVYVFFTNIIVTSRPYWTRGCSSIEYYIW